MEDCRIAHMRARAAHHRAEASRQTAEAARLEAAADAALAARAVGVSQWGSGLPLLIMQHVLEHAGWQPAVCCAVRAVCSTWSSTLDALLPGRLQPRRSLALMEGKLGWYQSVTAVDLTECEGGVCGPLAELQSMPSLRSLSLPASCAERAVDAEAVCGLTTLTTLHLVGEEDERADFDFEQFERHWVLDLSRLTTLTSFHLVKCSFFVQDEQVRELSSLTGLTDLNLRESDNVTGEGLVAVRSLTKLTKLNLRDCPEVTDEVLLAVSSLPALTSLDLAHSKGGTSEGLRAVSSLTSLTKLNLRCCRYVTDAVLRAVSSLPALTSLDLRYCSKVTAAGVQALRNTTAAPSLLIEWNPPSVDFVFNDAVDDDDSEDDDSEDGDSDPWDSDDSDEELEDAWVY